MILLPVSVLTGLTPLQIEAILAHELAHVRRHDYFVNLLQTVVETLFFFHPAVWWLSGRIRDERENACDELAVALVGGDRLLYSRALLTVEESRPEVPLPGLAVAATGGSLRRRIQRLLAGEQAHLDIGPRWYAGVFTVAMAVTAAGGVVDETMPPIVAALSEVQQTPENQRAAEETAAHGFVSTDTGDARPSEVVRYAGDGNLETRWSWAESQARQRRYGRYWVGYLIDGDAARRHWIHFDRQTPVSIRGSVISGWISMDGDHRSLRVPGVPLEGIVGDNAPSSIALFIQYDNGRLTRVRVGSFVFPMSFGGTPLLWLGRASDAESVARIVALDRGTEEVRLRADLTNAIAAHTEAAVVVPVLERWALDASRPRQTREEAIDGLQQFSSPRVLAVLAQIARTDGDERVRAEAIDAIGDMQEPAAADTLRSFARTLSSERLRREAVGALGNLRGPTATAALREIANDPTADRRLQSRAVEALADAETAPNERVDALIEVVNNHPDETVQGRAAEALGNVRAEVAIPALARIVRNHRSFTVRRRAMEALTEFDNDERAAQVLVDVVQGGGETETRARAAEFLGEFHRLPAFEELRRIAATDGSLRVRRKAVEAYMDNAAPDRIVAFAREILLSDAPAEVKSEVLDGLDDVSEGKGIPLLIEFARTTTNNTLRRRALEALIESDDPRAIAALRQIR